MKIGAQSLEMGFANVVLEVPFFQRPYVWKKENWKELLDDLFYAEETHFLGSIIFKDKDNGSSKLKKYLVLDGQQRLTTLSVLMTALYDCAENEKKSYCSSIIDILFYKEKASDANYNISISHSYHDKLQFESVIGRVEDGKVISPILEELDKIDIDDITQKDLIKRCYKYFYETLSKKYQENPQDVIDFGNALLNKKNKIIVLIDLWPNDKEQKIFDSINTSGIRLSATDTIKNSLYQKLIDLSNNRDSIIEYYKRTWQVTFEKDDQVIEFWCSEKVNGNLKLQNSELLLRYCAVIKRLYNPSNNKTSQLADIYKNYIVDKNEDEIKNLIKEIIEYATTYKECFCEFDDSGNFEFDNVERRLFKILSMNNITIFTPYILFLLKTYANDINKLNNRFKDLEKLVIKSSVVTNRQKDANKQIPEFIDDPDICVVQKYCNKITSDMIRNNLKTRVSRNTTKTLLFWIELHRRNQDNKYDTQSLQYNYQLEHIMPIKWEEHWIDVPYDDNPKHKCGNNQILG